MVPVLGKIVLFVNILLSNIASSKTYGGGGIRPKKFTTIKKLPNAVNFRNLKTMYRYLSNLKATQNYVSFEESFPYPFNLISCAKGFLFDL